MIWQVMQDPELGCNSYIVGDEISGTALVVDPLGALGAEAYVLTAQDLGLAITHVAETHVHADHASAARDLADALGIQLSLSHNAPAAYPFNPLQEGTVIALGSVNVTVWQTPGHTPDSVSFVVTDTLRGSEPWIVMSGDSLFVGDVGRPDLADATPEKIEEAARQQYDSVRRFLSLPDFVELHPAHYGSSPCGGLFMSKKPSSTIGYERRYNRMLQITDATEFVDQQLKLLKPPPAEAAALRAQNLGQEASVAQ